MFNNFMRKLRLGVTVFVALIIVSAFANIFGFMGTTLGVMEIIGMIVIILIMSMLLYVIIYYWYGKEHKCPSCNKRFCLKKEGKEIIGRESVSVLVETNTRNRAGEVTGTQEQYVPGERTTYQINYVCKKCGERCHSTFSKDVPKV